MDEAMIAGFPKSAWDLFLAPLPLSSVVVKAPGVKGQYVKHQVCKEMLNAAFGVDGWTDTVKWVRETPQYVDKYVEKDSTGNQATGMVDGQPMFREKLGRHYAVACVRLTIGKPGGPRVWREDCGSQVSAADWSEASKGAVSEAIKRAAAQFGWASEVYQTEQMEAALGPDWEAAILPTYTPPWILPLEHSAKLDEWMDALGWEKDKKTAELAAACRSELASKSLGSNLLRVIRARDEVRALMQQTDTPPEIIAETVTLIVDLKTAGEIKSRQEEVTASFLGGGDDSGGHAGRRMEL